MQELKMILEEIDGIKDEYTNEDHDIMFKLGAAGIAGDIKNIIHKYMNDDWIPVEEQLPEVFGKYWATIRYDDGRISKPVVVDFRGVPQKYVVDTPNGREYETWGIDSAFHGSRVIAWRQYYIPEPYRPEGEKHDC